ncbi:hypothetical protein BK411_19755 [Vibrio splendidus]|nr:hypothetical protein BK411_19755 [Vibrio splendidus]
MKFIFKLFAGLGFVNIILLPIIFVVFASIPQLLLAAVIAIPLISFVDIVFGISEKKKIREYEKSSAKDVEQEKLYTTYINDQETVRLDKKLATAQQKLNDATRAYDASPTKGNFEAEMKASDKVSRIQFEEVDKHYRESMKLNFDILADPKESHLDRIMEDIASETSPSTYKEERHICPFDLSDEQLTMVNKFIEMRLTGGKYTPENLDEDAACVSLTNIGFFDSENNVYTLTPAGVNFLKEVCN